MRISEWKDLFDEWFLAKKRDCWLLMLPALRNFSMCCKELKWQGVGERSGLLEMSVGELVKRLTAFWVIKLDFNGSFPLEAFSQSCFKRLTPRRHQETRSFVVVVTFSCFFFFIFHLFRLQTLPFFSILFLYISISA